MPSVSFTARVTIPGASTTTSETGIHLDNEHVKLQAVINGFAVPLTYSIIDGDDDDGDDNNDDGDGDGDIDCDASTPRSLASSDANDNVSGSLLMTTATAAAVKLLLLPLQASVTELLKQQVEIREEIGLLWDEVNDHRRCTRPLTDAYQRQQHEQLMRRAELSFDRYVASRHVDGPAAVAAAAAVAANRRGWGIVGGVPSGGGGGEKVNVGGGHYMAAGAGAGAGAGAVAHDHESLGMQERVKIEAQADEQQFLSSRKRPLSDL